jgi:hypothetical protein
MPAATAQKSKRDPIDLLIADDDRVIGAGKITTISEYLKTGQSNCTYGDAILIEADGELCMVKKGVVFYLDMYEEVGVTLSQAKVEDIRQAIDAASAAEDKPDEPPVAVLCERPKNVSEKAKGCKLFMVCNGDTRDEEFDGARGPAHNLGGVLGMPTLSFICLSRLIAGESDPWTSAYALIDGRVQIVAYSPDEKRVFTKRQQTKMADAFAKEKKKLKRKLMCWEEEAIIEKMFKAPASGFTLMHSTLHKSTHWHRAATALLREVKGKSPHKSLLIGFDEGSYFGCRFGNEPRNLDEAFRELTPKEARGVDGVLRQGEWFAVPVPEKKVPSVEDCAFVASVAPETEGRAGEADHYTGIALPFDRKDSSRHVVGTDTKEGIRFGKDGRLYVHDPNVQHSAGQHAELSGKGWFVFYCNTAVDSVSLQGVD